MECYNTGQHGDKVLYKFHLQVKYLTNCGVLEMVLNGFNEVLYKFTFSSYGTIAYIAFVAMVYAMNVCLNASIFGIKP